MNNPVVSIVRYERPRESVRKVLELAGGLDRMPHNARVFIKPNIVLWATAVAFPKWGVITTSRVVEDVVTVLREYGVGEIIIGEGPVLSTPKDHDTPAHAFQSLGYRTLEERYGVKVFNVFDRVFEKVDLGNGVKLNFNSDILHSDFVINLPVLKTHAVTVVSLGIKNLKGTIDTVSRKKCHNADPVRNLHYMISKLADPMPPMFTLLDGIYTNERGPAFDGRARRSDILIGSWDVLAGDMVGCRVLGYEPSEVPHIEAAANERGRAMDLSEITVVGETIESATSKHEYDFPFNEDESLPLPFVKMGIRGLSYRKYDTTLCTYCTPVNGATLTAIARAWTGKPWDEVEVLTGKIMKPTPGMKKTILLGKCIYQANKDHPDIQEMIAVKGCPPSTKEMVKALKKAGIDVDPKIFEDMDKLPGQFMKRYQGKAEFVEEHFRVE